MHCRNSVFCLVNTATCCDIWAKRLHNALPQYIMALMACHTRGSMLSQSAEHEGHKHRTNPAFLWHHNWTFEEIYPTKQKHSICISDPMQTTFFYLGRFLKKLADHQCSSITKGSIYHIKHTYIQLFSMEVDWPEIWRLMEVSAMFYICRYCVFT